MCAVSDLYKRNLLDVGFYLSQPILFSLAGGTNSFILGFLWKKYDTTASTTDNSSFSDRRLSHLQSSPFPANLIKSHVIVENTLYFSGTVPICIIALFGCESIKEFFHVFIKLDDPNNFWFWHNNNIITIEYKVVWNELYTNTHLWASMCNNVHFKRRQHNFDKIPIWYWQKWQIG